MYIIMKQTVELAARDGRDDIIDNLNELHRQGKLVTKETYYKYETDEEQTEQVN